MVGARSVVVDGQLPVVGGLVGSFGGDLGDEGVDSGGAEPFLGPGVDIAVAGVGEGVDEVVESGVGEAVAGEVFVDAGEEVLFAEPGDELAQGAGAFGVGDAVEVEFGGGGVEDVLGFGGDGVGGGALVGVVAPGFAGDGEVGPGVGVLGGFGDGLVAHVFGEGLVEPDVVPPLEGDEVAEPHVGHFVGDDHDAGLAFGVGDGRAEDEFVAEGDESGVFHRAGVEFGDECLVVGVEGVGLVEFLVVAVEAAGGEVEEFLGVGVEVGGEGLAYVEAEGDAAVFGAYGVPGSGGDGHEVGADGRGGGELPVPFGGVSGAGGDAVAEDGPLGGRGDGGVEDGFEVGLVEGGEDAGGVGEAALGVDVGGLVEGVGEAVHALAGVGVGRFGLYAQFVFALGEGGEGVSAVGRGGRVEVGAVEGDAAQAAGGQFDEGVRPWFAYVEADGGGGAEAFLAAGEVEVDGVAVDVEEAGSGLRFFAREYGHGLMVPQSVMRGHGGLGQAVGVVVSAYPSGVDCVCRRCP